MYIHKQPITARIFVIGQILFKIQGFEIGEMEVEHPVHNQYAKFFHQFNFVTLFVVPKVLKNFQATTFLHRKFAHHVVSFLTYLKAEVGSRLEMRSASCEFQKIEQSLSRRLRGYYSCPVKHVPRSLGPWSKSQLQGCWSLWPQRSVCPIRGFPNASSSS